jgi:hypothetical protein
MGCELHTPNQDKSKKKGSKCKGTCVVLSFLRGKP